MSLHIIAELVKLSRDGLVIPTRTILSIIAYTNPDDPWSSSPCAELSQSLLSAYFRSSSSFQPIGAGTRPGKVSQQTEQERFITEDVLTSFLRPLFAKSRPTTVTASGRPAAFPEPPSRYSQGDGFGGDADDIAVTKPWKYKHRYAVAIFEWAVENADVSTRPSSSLSRSKLSAYGYSSLLAYSGNSLLLQQLPSPYGRYFDMTKCQRKSITDLISHN